MQARDRRAGNFTLVFAFSARHDGQISRARQVCCPTGLLADAEVWSRFEYTDTCSGRPVAIPIEPLVGLLRHPTAHRCEQTRSNASSRMSNGFSDPAVAWWRVSTSCWCACCTTPLHTGAL